MLEMFVLHVYFICTTLYQHNIRVSQCYVTGIPWHVMFIQICMCGLHRFLACRRCCGPFVSFFIQLCIDTARSRVYETVERPSICLSHRLTAAAACGEFPAGRPAAGDIDRLQTPALCSNPAAAQYWEANAGSVMSTAEERKRTCFITSHDYNMTRQTAKLLHILTIWFRLKLQN